METKKQDLIPCTNEFQIMQTMARTASSSGLYANVGNEQKILMILLAAHELGIKPMMALNGGIWNIQGKIEISARLMNSMIRRAGHSIKVVQCDSSKCVLEGKRADNGDSFTAQFTMEEAQRAGLASRAVWKNYAEDMLYARAMSRLARRLFPDVIGTAYVEGEIRDGQSNKNDPTNLPLEEAIEISEIAEETQEQIDQKILNFVNQFRAEDHEFIKTYLEKYSTHWKKSISQAIDDYVDQEKFLIDFTKWKSKQIKVPSA